ncbi:heme utilization cystosolic carrier protein HutX [Uliginosibacterium sediminicola]|uniref:Heme utilization cystosolic carrier protein HutX n=1 Tax=Uliginosibacterium sediminicola TaxID=2024550 RepID=A0ABU9YZ11_9RHOO
MNISHETSGNALETLRTLLASNPSGVLETLAAEHAVSTQTVVECLPAAHRSFAAGSEAERVLLEISAWGSVTVLVHTPDLILECKGPLPAGRCAHGYYNIGGGSPLSGHLRLDRCAAIAFVRRPFMGADSCSVNFFNAAGEAMFKVFVGRDEKRALRADQLQFFTQLREQLCGEIAG